MSKKFTSTQPNTILNYFQSPKSNKISLTESGSFEDVQDEKTATKIEVDEVCEDEPIATQSKKRSRVIDSDSDNENSEQNTNKTDLQSYSKKVKIESSTSPKETKASSGDFDQGASTSGSSMKIYKKTYDEPKRKEHLSRRAEYEASKGHHESKKSEHGSKKSSHESKKSSHESRKSEHKSKRREHESKKTEHESKKTGAVGNVVWVHEKLDFLKPNHIRDSRRRKRTEPDYDPRTLHVPDSYLSSLTPAMRQWWILKSQHYDSILFFKVGKFYELYHMDAVIGVNALGFSYMRGEFAHSGFPESAYGRFAHSLTQQGYKVVRVEQTETPEMMAERCKKSKSKVDKVVNREICQITTKGSYMYGPQMTEAKSASHNFMLAIAEKVQTKYSTRYGVCFVDTSIGVFHLAEFTDDRHSSKLLALLSEHPPALILVDRHKLSSAGNELLKKYAGGVRIERLSSCAQFYRAEKTVLKLRESKYFYNDQNEFSWPKVLCDLIENDTCKPDYELALSALGACHWYLKDSVLDIQVFSMKQFRMYQPFEHGELKSDNKYMILDAVSIQNLNLLGKVGTLQKSMDFCCTAFGKRLLLDWIYRPLCHIEKITLRQAAVKELYDNKEWLSSARHILKRLPDLDRQIMKIHTFGSKQLAEQHPDSRAIFYEAKTYFKRKIYDLTCTLKGFDRSTGIPKIFKNCESKLLRKITHCSPDGIFHDLTDILEYFKSAFNQEEASSHGKIIPQAGIDAEFDKAEEVIKGINKELDEYLHEQRQFFNTNVVYVGSDRKRYHLEIPESKCHKVTSEYSIESTKKGSKPVNRYSTPRTKELLAKMMKAENDRSNIIADLNRRIFAKFNERYTEWTHVTKCLATLDVLCSLAQYARKYSHDVCLPEITPFSDNPFIKIENGRHPCIPNIDDYVPNGTELGTDDKAGILILTGPNMGGKSTLMRQVALILVMAQIGGYVPASSCQMSLIDRIFTRLGAQDDIMTGQSTFFVEVSEASAILQHATKHSFVLLDELGRGTSTHDGNAIATAYMKKLLEINCRVIYSTHYHTLVEYYGGRPDIQLGHMACLVENEEGKETVTFLYKLESGVCSNSYGFNVAKLAGLPNNIVEYARDFAKKLEETNNNRLLFIKLFTADHSSLREVITAIKNLNI